MSFDLVFTLGPSTEDPALLERLSRSASAFRLNGSHLDEEGLKTWLARLARLPETEDGPLPLVLDLQGEKMRIGPIAPVASLPPALDLVLDDGPSAEPHRIPVPHEELFRTARRGDELLLDDGRVLLVVDEVSPHRLGCVVRRDGPLSSRKGINRKEHPVRLARLLERDLRLLVLAAEHPRVRYACSFVHDAASLALVRPHTDRPVVAKIERPEALDALPAIAAAFDGCWFCRGDLGSQAGLARLGPLQSRYEALMAEVPGPHLLAGQVLEHMTAHATPTRSEVVHLHDCRQRGWSGIVLSDETAVGRHPEGVAELLDELLGGPRP